MQALVNTKCKLGTKIAKYNNEILGEGLYQQQQSIYSSLTGFIAKNANNHYFIRNSLQIKSIGPHIGSVVYCRVLKIKEDQALVEILQIEDSSTLIPLDATIRKQHVRQKLIDQVVMHECFRPNDIIKAKVISLGDSLRTLYLTTAGENLGVVVAVNEKSGKIMIPFDWTTMIDVESNDKESRKVAKPEL